MIKLGVREPNWKYPLVNSDHKILIGNHRGLIGFN